MKTRIVVKKYNSGRTEWVCEKKVIKEVTFFIFFKKLIESWEVITFKWGYGIHEYDHPAIFETEEQAKLCVEDFLKREERKKQMVHNSTIKTTSILTHPKQ